ncbi:MAG TPA: sensor histidine kinase [Candidatus Eremiobacteraeota bacterium]|nr:sensor histidine kinase [Candidatus Eremiobacteraeota bacterium]
MKTHQKILFPENTKKLLEEELLKARIEIASLKKTVSDHEKHLLEAHKKIASLERIAVDKKKLKKKLNLLEHELKEGYKELMCIYNIFNIMEQESNLEQIIQDIVNVIPSSWQYPDITCSRIMLEDREFKTRNFRETPYKQISNISIYGRNKGTVEIYYLEEKPLCYEGPFLKSERNLIKGISQTLGKIIERKRAEEEIKNSHKKLQELLELLQVIREEERKDIAREIHDELGQLLTALKIDIKWLDKRVNEPELGEKINSMTELIDMTIQNVRRIASELRPVILDDFGLSAAILWHAKEIEKRTGIKFKITFIPEDITMDKNKSVIIYRIIQELLTNIVRHASAKKVEIKLKNKNNKLFISVKDNGTGIEENNIYTSKSFGLLGIKERVHYWGGVLHIKGKHNIGTSVTIILPVDE